MSLLVLMTSFVSIKNSPDLLVATKIKPPDSLYAAKGLFFRTNYLRQSDPTNRFSTAAGIICHDWGTTSFRLKIDRGEIVFDCRIEQNVGCAVNTSEITLGLCAIKAKHTFRKGLHLLLT